MKQTRIAGQGLYQTNMGNMGKDKLYENSNPDDVNWVTQSCAEHLVHLLVSVLSPSLIGPQFVEIIEGLDTLKLVTCMT